jgi:hypothetical protein
MVAAMLTANSVQIGSQTTLLVRADGSVAERGITLSTSRTDAADGAAEQETRRDSDETDW